MPADEHPFEPLMRPTLSLITFEDWLMFGIDQGYCSEPVCDTHDGIPMSDEEQEMFNDGGEPCIPVVRLKNEVL